MSDLIAIGYPLETTAERAAQTACELADGLGIEPDAIAITICDRAGTVGAGFGPLSSQIAKSGMDPSFQDQVRDLIQPGTSALFFIVEKVGPQEAVEALSAFGGTALTSPVSREAAANLQRALHGKPAAA